MFIVGDAYRFIIPLAALALLSWWLGSLFLAAVAVLLLLFVAFFFRNPHRQIPAGDRIVVSPADGKVVKISEVPAGTGMDGGHTVSIFLNIFNVHVTRTPVGGTLEGLEYKRGKFKVASHDEASYLNEQNILTIRGPAGRIVVKQIAGLIARRVVCWVKPGTSLTTGELFGLIRFGSRVDVVVPREVKLLVRVGDRVKGGTSIIGESA
jgi:phosphatidylserine decarboxylase